ncbi:hypothetical protein ABFG93_00945 [Pseudalkalibacillus hwajinpoensis]
MLREQRTISLSGSLLLTNVWGYERTEEVTVENRDYARNNSKQELKETK